MSKKNSKSLAVLRILVAEGLGWAGMLLILSVVYTTLKDISPIETLGTTLKLAGIAFLVGCVAGLRKL